MPSVVSVNVGLPRTVGWHGEAVTTGIFKTPVAGAVRVAFLNLEGDRQADLTVHGGKDKAVYAYPSEHYEYWRAVLPRPEIEWGAFGENLTTDGFDEESIAVSDRLRIGSALFEVAQPRIPCFKLALRFDDQSMVKRFLQSRRTGYYVRVIEEGELVAGDSIDRIAQGSITIADVLRAGYDKPGDLELIRRAASATALPEAWRAEFRQRLSGRP
jgi:MOSC domain-containing protein YiiM